MSDENSALLQEIREEVAKIRDWMIAADALRLKDRPSENEARINEIQRSQMQIQRELEGLITEARSAFHTKQEERDAGIAKWRADIERDVQTLRTDLVMLRENAGARYKLMLMIVAGTVGGLEILFRIGELIFGK